VDEKPKRRLFRFSLRTLFVVVTLLGCLMGWVVYSLNWIHQRRNPRAHGIAGALVHRFSDRPAAPGFLWVFGEGGFDYIEIVIDGPADPQNPRRPLRKERTPEEQAVRERAADLFPEAEVREISRQYFDETYVKREQQLSALRSAN
jgi:hypothetical protein